MSVQCGHCLCLDCHRVRSWSSSNTGLLSEVEKGGRHVSALCFRSSSSTCSARSTRRLSRSAVSYGQSCVSCTVRKTEQGQENTMEVVRDPQGECACPPQEGGRGHRHRPCKRRSVQSLGEHSTTSTLHTLIPTQDRAMLLPKEHEMVPKDKYTVFSSTARGYRKGIHKVPKWTRVCPHFTLVEPLLTIAS